ncbi:hypothetical protein [Roseicitreum antarcticum]|nr:hypothetical protein [Roseicitreum antarcticum]
MSPSPGPGPRVSIIALAEGQGPWLLDWVLWHRLAGFDQVILCDPPGGGAADLLDALSRQGLAHGVAVPNSTDGDRAAQVRAAVNSPAAQAALDGSDWLLVAEVTDFLHAPAGLLPGLAKLTEASGLALPCVTFGSGGQAHCARRMIPARFTHRQAAGSVQRLPLRVLARYRKDWTWGLHRPALPKDEAAQWLTPGGTLRTADSLTWFLPPEDAAFTAEPGDAQPNSAQAPRINRYPLRSAEEYLLSRPAPLSAADLAEFARLNDAPTPDDSAAAQAEATTQAVASALKDPALRAAQNQQEEALRIRLAALRARPGFGHDMRALLEAMARHTPVAPLWPRQGAG